MGACIAYRRHTCRLIKALIAMQPVSIPRLAKATRRDVKTVRLWVYAMRDVGLVASLGFEPQSRVGGARSVLWAWL